MIKDRMELKGFEKIKMPEIHGHVKLQLRNVFSGNVVKEIEGDNLVTNAVRDIFGDNICGAVNCNSMLPLWSNWYRGVLCYKYAHDTDLQGNLSADNYYPKDSTTNPVTAHAGDTVPSDTTDDLTRGQPSATQTLTNNSVTIGWEWGASQGNGDISAISLCHKDTGNAGLGSTSSAFQAFQPFLDLTDTSILPSVEPSLDNTPLARYDDANALDICIGEGTYGRTNLSFETDKLTIFKKKLLYTKAGLLQTVNATKTNSASFTITAPFTLYSVPAYYFDESTKYLWLFTNITGVTTGIYGGDLHFSNSTIKYFVVDCANGSLVNLGTAQSPEYYKTIVSDTSDIAPLCAAANTAYSYDQNGRRVLTNIIKQGNYVYFPKGENSDMGASVPRMRWVGLKKINLADTSEQYSIPFGTTIQRPTCEGFNGHNGIEIMSGRVNNGLNSYACAEFVTLPDNPSYSMNYSSWGFSSPDKPISLFSPIGNGVGDTAIARYVLANKMLNTTLFNLPSTVTKGNNQSMSITYTLTEV